jgi:hypothetical protein
MNFFNYFAFFCVIIAGISMYYKRRYHKNVKNIDNLPKAVFYMNKFLMPNLFWPLRQRPHNDEDNKLRKKANVALLIFYVSFGLALLASIFAK